MLILNILGWCVFGLIVGAVSRFLLPGKDPMSWLMTAVIGIAGSFVFGLIFYTLFGNEANSVAPAGFIGSVVGSILVLLGVRYMRGSKTRKTSTHELPSN